MGGRDAVAEGSGHVAKGTLHSKSTDNKKENAAHSRFHPLQFSARSLYVGEA